MQSPKWLEQCGPMSKSRQHDDIEASPEISQDAFERAQADNMNNVSSSSDQGQV